MMRKLTPYLLTLPLIAFLVVFTYWPIVDSLYLSFHSWDFLSADMPFVGIANYRDLLTSPDFWNSLRITAIFAVVSVPLRLGLAIVVAAYLTREGRAVRILRGVLFLPSVTSAVSIAVVFSWFFSTDYGMANALLRHVGLAKVAWLQDPNIALGVVIAVNTWKQLGYDVVIYIAGLNAVPVELYDAAKVDGGRRWHVFRRVTLPLVMPTTYFLLIISVIDAFQIFTIVDVLTQGGPAGGTDVLINLLYRTSFTLFNIGTGSALAILLFAFLIGLAFVNARVIGRRVHYEA